MNSETEQSAIHPGHSQAPSEFARNLGKWIHEHRSITDKNPIGYTTYQYARSAVASVPYGLSMAGTYLGFRQLEKTFGNMKGGKTLGKPANYASRLFANPFFRTGAMIGTSFTLYRATSKIGKWTNEYLFNPEDSLETTIDKVDHLPEMLAEKCKEVYLPEAHSTMISAFVLSALVTLASQAAAAGPKYEIGLKTAKGLLESRGYYDPKAWGYFWKRMVLDPKSKSNFIPQAAIASLAYSLFFELGDRRFKDKQVSRGLWAGGANSIGSSSQSHPSLLQTPLHDQQSDPSRFDQTNDLAMPKKIGELPAGSRMGDTLSPLTSEPSWIRFALRRFIPTAIGITAYTAFKFRASPLIIGKFTAKDTFKGVDTPALEKLADIPRHAWREGAATSLFFLIPLVTDKYAPLFDRLVNNLEAVVSGRSYEQVIAGYQPKREERTTQLAANNDNQPKADNDNAKLAKTAEATPNAKVAQPVEHQARVVTAPAADLHA